MGIDMSRDEWDDLMREWEELGKAHVTEIAAKDAEIARLRATLQRYGQHRPGCAVGTAACMCGFDAALRGEGET